MDIGFIGLGVMGGAMARHLGAAGHRLALYDIDPAATDRAAGRLNSAIKAASPKEVAASSEIVFTMLPNGRVVRDCVDGDDGLLGGFAEGSLLIDTSSAEPWITRETAAKLAEKGVDMMEAPVSGAVEGAESATLVFMCGGSEDAVARARPLLEAMGRHIFHLGPIGSGHVMKTINNLATAVIWQATAEAMLIGKAEGLSAEAMVDVLNVSTGMSFITQKKMRDQILSRAFTDPFKLELMLKDMDIATELGRTQRLSLPVSELAHQLWALVDKQIGPGRSITEICRWYEDAHGIALADGAD